MGHLYFGFKNKSDHFMWIHHPCDSNKFYAHITSSRKSKHTDVLFK